MNSTTVVDEIAHRQQTKAHNEFALTGSAWQTLSKSEKCWIAAACGCRLANSVSKVSDNTAETCERQHKSVCGVDTQTPLTQTPLGPSRSGLAGTGSVRCFCVRRRGNCFRWRYSHADKLEIIGSCIFAFFSLTLSILPEPQVSRSVKEDVSDSVSVWLVLSSISAMISQSASLLFSQSYMYFCCFYGKPQKKKEF